MHVYWFDAHELGYQGRPDAVALFGYLPNGKRVCIRLEHVPKVCMLLLHESTARAAESCRQQVRALLGDAALIDGPHTRQYCFERDERKAGWHMQELPLHRARCLNNAYMRVQIPPGAAPPLQQRLVAGVGAHYKQVLPTPGGALQRLLVERRIQGPGWLALKGLTQVLPEAQRLSTCALEFAVRDLDCVAPVQEAQEGAARAAPPLAVLCVTLQWWRGLPVPQLAGFHAELRRWSSAGAEEEQEQQQGQAKDSLWVVRTWMRHDVLTLEQSPEERALAERSLLLELFNACLVHADLVVGFRWHDVELPRLASRLRTYELQSEVALGRLKPRAGSGGEGGVATYRSWRESSALLAGQLVLDAERCAVEYLPKPEQHVYSLSALAAAQLCKEVSAQEIAQLEALESQRPCAASTLALASRCMWRVLSRNEIPRLTLALTQIAGNTWGQTLNLEKSAPNQWFLLHAFHARDFVLPAASSSASFSAACAPGRDPRAHLSKAPAAPKTAAAERDAEADSENENQNEAEAESALEHEPEDGGAYRGGTVLRAARGFWRDVALLDIQSSYPSNMRKHNVCFSTLQHWRRDAASAAGTGAGAALRPELARLEAPLGAHADEPRGVLAEKAGELLDTRLRVQQELRACADPRERARLQVRERALKLFANCLYGCLHFYLDGGLFHSPALAGYVTACGRLALQTGVRRVARFRSGAHRPKVIYGDTDSLMVALPGCGGDRARLEAEARALAAHISLAMPGVPMKLDGLYRQVLLYKKKKYSALPFGAQAVPLCKGLELVRSDWCPLAAQSSRALLALLHAYLPLLAPLLPTAAESADSAQGAGPGAGQSKRAQLEPLRREWREAVEQLFAETRKRASECRDVRDFVIVKELGQSLQQHLQQHAAAAQGSSPAARRTASWPPHLQAAFLLSHCGHDVRAGSRIAYVQVRAAPGPACAWAQRDFGGAADPQIPFHPEAVPYEFLRHWSRQRALDVRPNFDYYCRKQIAPVLQRLLEPFEALWREDKLDVESFFRQKRRPAVPCFNNE